MTRFYDESFLEIVEMYAADNGLIDSEEALSERFDQYINEMFETKTAAEFEQYVDDEVMVNEDFSNWMDGLHKDGQLHSEQENNYCYVGEWT